MIIGVDGETEAIDFDLAIMMRGIKTESDQIEKAREGAKKPKITGMEYLMNKAREQEEAKANGG